MVQNAIMDLKNKPALKANHLTGHDEWVNTPDWVAITTVLEEAALPFHNSNRFLGRFGAPPNEAAFTFRMHELKTFTVMFQVTVKELGRGIRLRLIVTDQVPRTLTYQEGMDMINKERQRAMDDSEDGILKYDYIITVLKEHTYDPHLPKEVRQAASYYHTL